MTPARPPLPEIGADRKATCSVEIVYAYGSSVISLPDWTAAVDTLSPTYRSQT